MTHTNLLRIVSTTALTAVALFAAPMTAHAQIDPGSWTDLHNKQNVLGHNSVANGTGGFDNTILTGSGFSSATSPNLNIALRDSVNVVQGDSNSLFAITKAGTPDGGRMSARPTDILGKMTSNGTVIVSDINGVIFGRNSIVDAAGFAAIGGNIDKVALERTLGTTGSVQVTDLNGDITIEDGATINVGRGLNAFLGRTVTNGGSITSQHSRFVRTPARSINLASGRTATLDLFGDGLVEVAVTDGHVNSHVTNNGTIDIRSRLSSDVFLTAFQAENAINNAINMNGRITAQDVTVTTNGTIVLNGNILTAEDVEFNADTLNVNRNSTTTTPNIDFNVDTINLNGRMYLNDGMRTPGLLTRAGITSTASTVNVLNPSSSIQQGVHFAADSATVNVHGDYMGYEERVTLDRPVHLKGISSPIMVPMMTDGAVILLAPPMAKPILYGSIIINSGDVSVSNIDIRDNYSTGITIRTSGSNINIFDNIIQGNMDDRSKAARAPRHTGYGIWAQGLSGTNSIYGNLITNKASGGIHLEHFNRGSTMNITGNDIINNSRRGIDLLAMRTVNISDNEIDGNSGSGINARWVDDLNIDDNRIVENDNFGIYYYESDDATITNNIMSNNSRAIYAYKFRDMALTGNTIEDNRYGGVDLHDYDSATITGNSIGTNHISDDMYGPRHYSALHLRNGGKTTTITDNTLFNSVYGLVTTGELMNDVVLAGNTFDNNNVGANFRAGKIDLTGNANTASNNEIGFLFGNDHGEKKSRKGGSTSYPLSLVNDTIGTSTFLNNDEFDVALAGTALFDPGAPTLLDASQASFDDFISGRSAISAASLAAIEEKVYHYIDDPKVGLFYFGQVDTQTDIPVDIKDIIKKITPESIPSGSLSLTLNGLPNTGFEGGVAGLNNIAPAAGSENPDDLNDIEAASGDAQGSGQSTPCLGRAVNSASEGGSSTFNFGSGVSSLLGAAATCGDQL